MAVACSTVLGVEEPRGRAPLVDGGVDAAPDACTDPACLGCSSAERACDGQCRALDDPQHCGACGHDCQGGSCVDSRCGEVTLVSSLASATSLVALDDGVAFIGSGDGPVRVMASPRAPLGCTGNDERCTLPAPQGSFSTDAGPTTYAPLGLARTEDYLYVEVPSRGIARRPLSAPRTTPFEAYVEHDEREIRELTTTVQGPYLAVEQPGWLLRMAPGNVRTRGEATTGVPVPFGLVSVDGDFLVGWIAGPAASDVMPGLHRVPASPLAATCFGNACVLLEASVYGLATHKGELLVALEAGPYELDLGLIPAGTTRCARPTCPQIVVERIPSPFAATVQGQVPLLLDDQFFYWVAGSATRASLFRTPRAAPCSPEAGTCEEILQGRTIPSLAQDAHGIFAAVKRSDTYAVVRVAK